MKQARGKIVIMHRARPAARKSEEENEMESYRTQIIAMLDTVVDAQMMRMIYHVIRAIMMCR